MRLLRLLSFLRRLIGLCVRPRKCAGARYGLFLILLIARFVQQLSLVGIRLGRFGFRALATAAATTSTAATASGSLRLGAVVRGLIGPTFLVQLSRQYAQIFVPICLRGSDDLGALLRCLSATPRGATRGAYVGRSTRRCISLGGTATVSSATTLCAFRALLARRTFLTSWAVLSRGTLGSAFAASSALVARCAFATLLVRSALRTIGAASPCFGAISRGFLRTRTRARPAASSTSASTAALPALVSAWCRLCLGRLDGLRLGLGNWFRCSPRTEQSA